MTTEWNREQVERAKAVIRDAVDLLLDNGFPSISVQIALRDLSDELQTERLLANSPLIGFDEV